MAHVVFAAREPGDPNYDESSYSPDNPEGASLAYGANVLWQHVDCAEFIILNSDWDCMRRLRKTVDATLELTLFHFFDLGWARSTT